VGIRAKDGPCSREASGGRGETAARAEVEHDRAVEQLRALTRKQVVAQQQRAAPDLQPHVRKRGGQRVADPEPPATRRRQLSTLAASAQEVSILVDGRSWLVGVVGGGGRVRSLCKRKHGLTRQIATSVAAVSPEMHVGEVEVGVRAHIHTK